MNKHNRLWQRYWAITDQHAKGYATPILWHLALRHDPAGMLMLGDSFKKAGRVSDPWSQEVLAYRAFRRGYAIGAQHLAMNAFNRGDLVGYRHWLARAARRGDDDAKRQLARFETRLPHRHAARIGRKRSQRSYDFS